MLRRPGAKERPRLANRYAHDQGGLLFYLVKTANAHSRLSGWRIQLTTDGYQCADCGKNKLAFYSTHKLTGSGTDFKVRSMAVTLFHQPLDKSARNSAAKSGSARSPAKPAKKSVKKKASP